MNIYIHLAVQNMVYMIYLTWSYWKIYCLDFSIFIFEWQLKSTMYAFMFMNIQFVINYYHTFVIFFLLETAFLSKYFYAGQWRNKICQYTIISWILPFKQRYFAMLLDGLSLIMRWNKRYYKKRYDTIELSHVLYLLS